MGWRRLKCQRVRDPGVAGGCMRASASIDRRAYGAPAQDEDFLSCPTKSWRGCRSATPLTILALPHPELARASAPVEGRTTLQRRDPSFERSGRCARYVESAVSAPA